MSERDDDRHKEAERDANLAADKYLRRRVVIERDEAGRVVSVSVYEPPRPWGFA